jgi:hypothetical protein
MPKRKTAEKIESVDQQSAGWMDLILKRPTKRPNAQQRASLARTRKALAEAVKPRKTREQAIDEQVTTGRDSDSLPFINVAGYVFYPHPELKACKRDAVKLRLALRAAFAAVDEQMGGRR